MYRSLHRRHFLGGSTAAFGSIALADLLLQEGIAASDQGGPHPAIQYPKKVKRVVQLFMAGAASHLDLFDYKPELVKRHGQPSGPGTWG